MTRAKKANATRAAHTCMAPHCLCARARQPEAPEAAPRRARRPAEGGVHSCRDVRAPTGALGPRARRGAARGRGVRGEAGGWCAGAHRGCRAAGRQRRLRRVRSAGRRG